MHKYKCCQCGEEINTVLTRFFDHNGDYYLVGNEIDVIEEFKRQLIKKLETDIEHIKKAKVA